MSSKYPVGGAGSPVLSPRVVVHTDETPSCFGAAIVRPKCGFLWRRRAWGGGLFIRLLVRVVIISLFYFYFICFLSLVLSLSWSSSALSSSLLVLLLLPGVVQVVEAVSTTNVISRSSNNFCCWHVCSHSNRSSASNIATMASVPIIVNSFAKITTTA